MEDTRTNSCQNFRKNKYGIFVISLASAFSVNAMAQEKKDNSIYSNTIQITVSHKETIGTSKIYSFPTKKNFRDRYKRIAQSDWFKNTHCGMSIGEIEAIEE